jgi:XRE family transcriptional regulator, regulator of sulfur utilization
MIEENLGAALRQLRARQHLSLRTLAERTGFSPSFLSQVENGQSSPSLSSIEKITAALGLTLGEFFQSMQVSNAAAVLEHARREWHLQWLQAHVETIGLPGEATSLAAFIVTMDAGGSSGAQPHSPPFDEFAYVLEGHVTLTMNTEHRKLRVGEGILLRAGQSRHWENTNASRARVLLVSENCARQS